MDQSFAVGQEHAGYRPHQKGADKRSDSDGSAHEKAHGDKTDVHQNSDRSERFCKAVA